MAKTDQLQGALEVLVLKALLRGQNSGYAIANLIEQASDEVLRVEEGSLYPALHRMTERGWLKAEWRISDSKRKARFYEITGKGRKHLAEEEQRWKSVTAAVAKVLRTV